MGRNARSAVYYDGTYYKRGVGTPFYPIRQLLTNDEWMISLNHPDWKSGHGDNGGPWVQYRNLHTVNPVPSRSYYSQGSVALTYVPTTLVVPFPVFMAKFAADGFGTTAIARTVPTRPVFDAAQAIGEAREGLPKTPLNGVLKSRTAELHRSAGNEYLNVVFGWLPLMDDLRKFCYGVKHHKKILERFHRLSEVKIKTSYDGESEQVQDQKTERFASSGLEAFVDASAAQMLTKRTWFEGAYRYYAPLPSADASKLRVFEQEANKVLGTRLTPKTVWELTPWSWAADWFGTTGDVMSNLSTLGHDGLVLQYGYVMHEQILATSVDYKTVGAPELSGSYTNKLIMRQRFEATPYGFGFDLKSLTTRQVSILAALGLSKGGRRWEAPS
jgi:hypothetical protein